MSNVRGLVGPQGGTCKRTPSQHRELQEDALLPNFCRFLLQRATQAAVWLVLTAAPSGLRLG
jgi:hypothetical protein